MSFPAEPSSCLPCVPAGWSGWFWLQLLHVKESVLRVRPSTAFCNGTHLVILVMHEVLQLTRVKHVHGDGTTAPCCRWMWDHGRGCVLEQSCLLPASAAARMGVAGLALLLLAGALQLAGSRIASIAAIAAEIHHLVAGDASPSRWKRLQLAATCCNLGEAGAGCGFGPRGGSVGSDALALLQTCKISVQQFIRASTPSGGRPGSVIAAWQVTEGYPKPA